MNDTQAPPQAMPKHSNKVSAAAEIRARDEQQMLALLQSAQFEYGIYNSDIEPEHENDYCTCSACRYRRAKWYRTGVQRSWWKATAYPGESHYSEYSTFMNPYSLVPSPYGYFQRSYSYAPKPIPKWYTKMVHQTIDTNKRLNAKAQANIDASEPVDIWGLKANNQDAITTSTGATPQLDNKQPLAERNQNSMPLDSAALKKTGFLSRFMRSSSSSASPSPSRSTVKVTKNAAQLVVDILAEEKGRWPDVETRNIAIQYQIKTGMVHKIADLRERQPRQYLHLLHAGYFEPIPVAWADSSSNPLKFSIDAASGWRGITPAWRGFEDTAEERLYWVLNHREGNGVVARMKPDPVSEMAMARERMAKAVDPPPLYWSDTDQCHVQHTSDGYSKQVMPPPFHAYDRPELPTDDTMILLDVSGSMDFEPQRPIYNEYLVTGWAKSSQPKNKDVAKAIVQRFTDAMQNHDHTNTGYDFFTFSTYAKPMGRINHTNFESIWSQVRLGGGTRVMTGWQAVKEAHFRKHSESAVHHPVFGWQPGPETPILRLLLLLDGEATDMDEFELDLLGLDFAHVTIFLIGVDGCPHHHRHANELQRISDVNHHVSFVDAQGNCPERFVTHELLKRHLGMDISLQQFQELEHAPPAYAA